MIDCQNESDFDFLDDKLVWKVGDDRESRFEISKDIIEESRQNTAISLAVALFKSPWMT